MGIINLIEKADIKSAFFVEINIDYILSYLIYNI